MSELPKGWAECRLSDVADLNPSLDRCPYPADAAVHFVPMPAVEAETGKMDIGSTRAFSDVRKGYTAFVEGDVLFAKITPCMENGKMAVVPPLPLQVACGSTEFQVLRPRTDISPKYIYHFVSSKAFRYEAEANMTGAVGQKRVPSSFLTEHSIPLPPSAEQHRIVAKIEELFSELDASEESLTRARAQLGLYRQSLLKAAFQGTLTADWRAANPDKLETPEKLLARIQKERAEKRRDEPAIGERIRPEQLPSSWIMASLDQVTAESLIGIVRSSAEQNTDGNGASYIKMDRLDMEGRVNIAPTVFVSATGPEIDRYGLRAGDILFNTRNSVELVGKTALVRANPPVPTVFNNNLMRVRPVASVSSHFLAWQMIGFSFRQQLEKVKKATTSVAAIYGKDLWPLQICVASHAEQEEIVHILEERLSVLEATETDIATALTKISALRQSILKKAFAGELVPQDPADEPAAALLARIRAEAPASSPRRKKSA